MVTPEHDQAAEPYRELIRSLIAADEPCPAYGCGVTMLGHLIASLEHAKVWNR